MTTALQKLATYLAGLQAGEVSNDAWPQLSALLAHAWSGFSGSSATGMTSQKLVDRMEAVVWTPPKLAFRIERHGPTALGSIRTAGDSLSMRELCMDLRQMPVLALAKWPVTRRPG